MKKVTQLKIGPIAVLVLLALLTVLVVKRQHLTAEEAADDGVGTVVKVKDTVARDEFAAVAFLALIALFAFVVWTAVRAHEGKGKASPPAGDSSTSGTRASG
jgi:hypothetical protein